MKRRLISSAMTVTLTAALLAGCGGSNDTTDAAQTANQAGESASSVTLDQDAENAAADAKAAGKTVISFWHYMGLDKEGKYVQEAVDEFNSMQDEVYVEAQYLPRDELMKQYTIGVVSGELPDVGMVDNPDHNSYAAMGVFQDISELYKSADDMNFEEGALSSCYYDGKLYGLPWGNNCLGLFYNKALLEQSGVEVPTTWSELEAACEKLTTDGTKGLAISAINNEEGTFQFMPWLLSAGGSVNDLDSDVSKSAMTYLKGLIDKGYVSSECVNWTQADAEKQFASGKAAMMINGPWQFDGLKSDAPDLEYGVAQVPKTDDGEYASILGGENIGICTGADTEAAWKFVEWIDGKEESTKLFKQMGRLSSRSDINVKAQYADEPNWLMFAEIVPNAQSRGPSPEWPSISEAVYTAEQQVFTGQKDVDTAMSEAAETVAGLNANSGSKK